MFLRAPSSNLLRLIRQRAVIAAAAASVLIGIGLIWSAAAPPAIPARPSGPAFALLASDGEPFARRGRLTGAPVEVRDLPPYVPAAFVAIEDRRFYRHHGVDLAGVARAALANLRAGHVVQGGSTITEQLVKNTRLGPQQTLGRKLREAVDAFLLERRLSKDEILSRYLSTVYFGEGAWGLRAAAEQYFGVEPESLTLGQAALLAGLVKAPSDLAPHQHLPLAQARERVVLQALADTGRISAEQAAAEPPAEVTEAADPEGLGGYFADWVYSGLAGDRGLATGVVTVRTTLDRDLQRRAETAVREALDAYGQQGHVSQAALVAMRPDGAVVAMVGGREHRAGAFNRAVQAERQPGSTFKLFAYLAALRRGAGPGALVSDEPLAIGRWRPENADHQNHGLLTLEEAFARSSNLAAVRVGQAVGIPAVVLAARDLGVASRLDPVPSLPLGTSGVNLLELTSAYAAVAAGAYPVRPYGVAGEPGAGATPMDPDVRQGMLRLLHAAAEHGGGQVAGLPFDVYGKTGTSQNYRDALFVGFAGDLVVGVWVGNDDDRPMNQVYGGALPARIWAEVMAGAADQGAVHGEDMDLSPRPEGEDYPEA